MEQFEAIFQRHYTDIYRFLLRLCHYQESLAEELTQETFYQAYLSLPQFEGRCNVKTWLIQISKNCFYAMLRKKKIPPLSLEAIPAAPAADAFQPSLDENFAQQEMLQNALLIIDTMPDHMKEVLLYRIYSELTYGEIAALLSISTSSAKVLFHRGKLLLRTKLREVYGYEI